MKIGNKEFKVIVPDDPRKGLLGTNSISKDKLMKFSFPDGNAHITMKGMKYPIDLIATDGGKVTDVIKAKVGNEYKFKGTDVYEGKLGSGVKVGDVVKAQSGSQLAKLHFKAKYGKEPSGAADAVKVADMEKNPSKYGIKQGMLPEVEIKADSEYTESKPVQYVKGNIPVRELDENDTALGKVFKFIDPSVRSKDKGYDAFMRNNPNAKPTDYKGGGIETSELLSDVGSLGLGVAGKLAKKGLGMAGAKAFDVATLPIRRRVYKTIEPLGYSPMFKSDREIPHIESFIKGKPYVRYKAIYNEDDDLGDLMKSHPNYSSIPANDPTFIRQGMFKKYLKLDKENIPVPIGRYSNVAAGFDGEILPDHHKTLGTVDFKFDDHFKPTSDKFYGFKSKESAINYLSRPEIKDTIKGLMSNNPTKFKYFMDATPDIFDKGDGIKRRVLIDDNFGVMGGYNVHIGKEGDKQYLQIEDDWDIHPLQGPAANKYFFRDLPNNLLRAVKGDHAYSPLAEKLGHKLMKYSDKFRNIELGSLIGAEPVKIRQAWYIDKDGNPILDELGNPVEKQIKSHSKGGLLVLDDKANVQHEISDGSRIFSRVHTKQLLSLRDKIASMKAGGPIKESHKELAELFFKLIAHQDKLEPEYV